MDYTSRRALELRLVLIIKEILPKTSQRDNQKLKNILFDIEKYLSK